MVDSPISAWGRNLELTREDKNVLVDSVTSVEQNLAWQ
jgi:hypothetical protein